MHITITELIERLQYCLEEYGDILIMNREKGSSLQPLDGPHYDEREDVIYFEHY